MENLSEEPTGWTSVIIPVLVIVLLVLFALFSPKPEISRTEINVEVDMSVGNEFRELQGQLNFGQLPPEAVGKRKIVLSNPEDKKIKLIAGVDGEIKDWVEVIPPEITLDPKGSTEVEVVMKIPPDAEFKAYRGVLVVLKD